jgi:hypothetical protein
LSATVVWVASSSDTPVKVAVFAPAVGTGVKITSGEMLIDSPLPSGGFEGEATAAVELDGWLVGIFIFGVDVMVRVVMVLTVVEVNVAEVEMTVVVDDIVEVRVGSLQSRLNVPLPNPTNPDGHIE